VNVRGKSAPFDLIVVNSDICRYRRRDLGDTTLVACCIRISRLGRRDDGVDGGPCQFHLSELSPTTFCDVEDDHIDPNRLVVQDDRIEAGKKLVRPNHGVEIHDLDGLTGVEDPAE
jgi:hypothetical protein